MHQHRRKTSALNTQNLLERFSRLNVLVVGDLMLDHYVWGGVSRISPEAPVPVVDVSKETEMPGGAGNVALNMATLGANVHLVGLVGQDASASRLLSLFRTLPINTEPVIRSLDRPTIVKTRIIAHHQQVVRVDREVRGELPPKLLDQVWSRMEALLPKVDAVVLSDYAKGVISAALLKKLLPVLRRRKLPVTVDPKVENFAWYREVTAITPNLKEAMEGGKVHSVRTEAELEALGTRLIRQLNAQSILITRGEKGMSLFEKGKVPYHIPTRAREVFDVTGAGDTVISALTLALAAGASLRNAAEISNYAAGVVVGKIGTASVTPSELRQALRSAR